MDLNIAVEQPDKKLALFGTADRYLRMVRDAFGVKLYARDDEVRISGQQHQVEKAASVLEQMQRKLRRQDWLTLEDIGNAIARVRDADQVSSEGGIDVYVRGKIIQPKTEGQKVYLESIFKHDLTF